MSTSSAPGSPALSEQMRDGSRADHVEAESSGFITALTGGQVPLEGYVAYLISLQQVYRALEAVGRRLLDHPVGQAVVDSRLERSERLAADLDYWAGPSWRDTAVLSPATASYVERLEAMVADPTLFLAHHYTRYLGDLAGGQVVGRAVAQIYRPEAGVGLAFYDFPEIAKVKPYRDGYRERVDALALDASEQERVVEEVRRAFRLNRDLFAELGGRFDSAA